MAPLLDYLMLGYDMASDLFREKGPPLPPPEKRWTVIPDPTPSEYAHTYRLMDQVRELRKHAEFPSPEQFLDSFASKLSEAFYKAGVPLPVSPIDETMFHVAHMYYLAESFNDGPDFAYAIERGPIEVARYRDQLIKSLKKLADPQKTLGVFTAALLQAFIELGRSLPAFAHDTGANSNGAITIPLLDGISDVKPIVANLLAPFNSAQATDLCLFDALREQLTENKRKYAANSKKPDLADFQGTPKAYIQAALDETLLDALFAHQVPFVLPEETRFAGHWCIAPPGRGKTTLLHAMVANDLAKDACLVLMDSKGDLIEPIKNLRSIKDRLVLIEPSPEAAFALNPLDVTHTSVTQVVSLIEYIMAGLLDAKFTALQSTLFRNVVPAIIEAIPNPTLDTFKEVMVKGLPPASLDKINSHARQFFENRDTGFNSKTYESTRKEVVWRLDYLLTNSTLRSMFSASHTRLDIGREMDAGKVIIINNSKAILGDEGAEFFGRFFIALIARAAQQRTGRPAASKKPCYVYIDECQTVISKDARIPTLLDECRSQKIALILAHQRTAQLTPPVLDAVANCAIRMANSDDEAKYLAPKLRMDVETLQALPRGTFGTFVRDLTPQGVQLQISKIDLEALPKMTGEDITGIRERMRTDFSAATPTAEAPQPSEKVAATAAPEPPVQPKADSDPGEPSAAW